jgi:CBS domain-containing protein
MIAAELISDIVSPVKTSDKGEEVLTMMNLFHVRHLPIVNNEELLGVISEDDILSQDIDSPVGSYSLSMRRPFADMHTNIMEIMNIMAEYGVTSVPVVDKSNVYKGMVLQQDILIYFSKSATFHQPGSVIIIEMARQDYSLVEIAQLVELENASIIGLFIYEHRNPNSIRVILKINNPLLEHIIAALERYNYVVEASFSENNFNDSLQDRYDSLMKYLNV